MTEHTSISDDTKVAMPIRNIISIVGAVAISTWAYSGVIERLNRIETKQQVKQSQIELNSEFRIGWPRGTMGSLPTDAEQNREIQSIKLELDRIMEEVEENDEWIDEFEPPVEVLETIKNVRQMQIDIRIIQERLNTLLNNKSK
jgi:hypothetical protein